MAATTLPGRATGRRAARGPSSPWKETARESPLERLQNGGDDASGPRNRTAGGAGPFFTLERNCPGITSRTPPEWRRRRFRAEQQDGGRRGALLHPGKKLPGNHL